MKGEPMKFYCDECKKVIDRRFVKQKNYEDGFRCKWCGSTVYRLDKILASLCSDFFEYLRTKKKDVSEYE